MTYTNKDKVLFSESYEKFFSKNPSAKIVTTRGIIKPSSYLKLNLEDHANQDYEHFCLNDSDSALQAIRNHEKNFKIVDEGLIATFPTQDVLNHFRKIFTKIVDPSLVNASFPGSGQKIIDFYILSDSTEKISPQMMICVPAKDDDDIKRLVKLLTDDFVKCGYYMMSYDIRNFNSMKCVYMQFEAKYSDMIVDLEEILYHVSPLKYFCKIQRNGLVPYSKSSNFNYDSRVYLFNKCPRDQIYDYGAYKAKEVRDDGFCVFKVFKSKLLNDQIFRDGKHRFYLDTAFSMTEDGSTDQTAIFTYSNIPKRILSKYYAEVKIDNEGNIVSEMTKILK